MSHHGRRPRHSQARSGVPHSTQTRGGVPYSSQARSSMPHQSHASFDLPDPFQVRLSATDMVKWIVHHINRIKEGYVPAKEFFQFSPEFRSLKDIQSFIMVNSKNFTTVSTSSLSRNELVWVRTTLKLCNDHCRQDVSCVEDCGSLHICRNFLLKGEKCCPFARGKKTCHFGHDLFSNHNKALLVAHNLDYLTMIDIQILFRRRSCRSSSTMPQVCLYYNNSRGNRCTKKGCKCLHICLDHIKGCCFGTCMKNHNIFTKENERVLNLYAIDGGWRAEDLVMDLRQVMAIRLENDSASHYLGSQRDSDDDFSSRYSGWRRGSKDECSSHYLGSQDNSEDDDEEGARATPIHPQGSRGRDVNEPCCRDCKENKEHIASLFSTVERLENEIKSLKTQMNKDCAE